MLSHDSRSRMWDEKANTHARGEGVAALVLKTLSQAFADGDEIECLIRETGVNQDGRTKGIMSSSMAQENLVRDTYRRAGLNARNPMDRPHSFEAHGTGTPAGIHMKQPLSTLLFLDIIRPQSLRRLVMSSMSGASRPLSATTRVLQV